MPSGIPRPTVTLHPGRGMLYTQGMASKKIFLRQFGRSFAPAGKAMLGLEAPKEAAAISYFVLISLFPAILVLVWLVDTFLGWMDLHGVVVDRIMDLFPGSAIFLRSSLEELTAPSKTVIVSCIVVVVWSTSWIFSFLEGAINRAWGASHQKTFWETRLRSIAFMILGSTSLLVSAAVTTSVSNARARAAAEIPALAREGSWIGWFWSLSVLGAGLLIAMFVFALIFKWLPHRTVYWREAFSGAFVFILLWEIGSILFARLLPGFDYQRVYGRTGTVIAVLVWVYTSSLILIFGANFSAQLHQIRMQPPQAGIAFSKGKIRRLP